MLLLYNAYLGDPATLMWLGIREMPVTNLFAVICNPKRPHPARVNHYLSVLQTPMALRAWASRPR